MYIYDNRLVLRTSPGIRTYRKAQTIDPPVPHRYEVNHAAFGGSGAWRPVPTDWIAIDSWYVFTGDCDRRDPSSEARECLDILLQLGWLDVHAALERLAADARGVHLDIVRRRAHADWNRPGASRFDAIERSDPAAVDAELISFHANPRAARRAAEMSEWESERFLAQTFERALCRESGWEPREWIMAGPTDPDCPEG